MKEREEAKIIDETELVPTEPVTVILSEKGWVRTAKGHDIEPGTLNYRTGDEFKAASQGRSNQLVVFIDSTGRCYSLPAHSLPSARSLGEPVSSRLNPPDGASYEGVMLGTPYTHYLLASDAGYGFIAKLDDLYTKNKSGKAIVSVPKHAGILTPAPVNDYENDLIAAVSSIGRLLVFQIKELPVLGKGKGLKIIQIPAAKLKTREEYVVAMTTLSEDADLIITAGQRKFVLKNKDLEKYTGERGRRGNMLPRGYRQVKRIEPLSKE